MASTSSSSASTPQNRSRFGDTTMTKVFVGGLAWETPNEKLHQHFRRFGEILEAVIITDKNTGKSKGYGFVTFREPEAARQAVQDPNPYIDGRRANCNIASLGRPRPSPPRGRNQAGSYLGSIQPMDPPYSRAPPAQGPPPAPQFLYPTYGYMPYPPEYPPYPHGMYSPQMGQAPYYQQQMFGATSPPSPLPYPAYPYGYFIQSPRPGFTPPARQQFMQYPSPPYHAEPPSQQPNVVQLQLPPHARQSPNTSEPAASQQRPTTGANNASPDTS